MQPVAQLQPSYVAPVTNPYLSQQSIPEQQMQMEVEVQSTPTVPKQDDTAFYPHLFRAMMNQ